MGLAVSRDGFRFAGILSGFRFVMKESLQKRMVLIILVMIMILIVPLVVGGMEVISPVLSISPIFALYFISLLFIKWYCIVVRSKIFLRYSGYLIGGRRILPILWSYELLSDLFPKNVVAPIACLAFFKRHNVSYAATLSLGFFCMVLDTFSILLIVAGGVLIGGLIGVAYFQNNYLLYLILYFLIFSILLSIFYRRSIGRIILKFPLHWFVPASKRDSVNRALMEIAEEIAKTENISPASAFALLLLSLVSWISRLSFLYLSIKAASHGIGWIEAMLIQVMSGVAGTLTFMPGGFPGADITVAALLSSKLGLTDTLAILVLWRIMTFYINVIVGGAALFWLGLGVSMRSLFPRIGKPG